MNNMLSFFSPYVVSRKCFNPATLISQFLIYLPLKKRVGDWAKSAFAKTSGIVIRDAPPGQLLARFSPSLVAVQENRCESKLAAAS